MLWTAVEIEGSNPPQVQVLTTCYSCDSMTPVTVTQEAWERYSSRGPGCEAQNVFPEMSDAERERIVSGTCPKCWADIFPPREDCPECLGDSVVCNTCDICGTRHCGTCDPCEA